MAMLRDRKYDVIPDLQDDSTTYFRPHGMTTVVISTPTAIIPMGQKVVVVTTPAVFPRLSRRILLFPCVCERLLGHYPAQR